MLKRQQVLITDWQADYIRDVAKIYDLSFSEIVRIFLSLGFVYVLSSNSPRYKTIIDNKGIKRMIKYAAKHNSSLNEIHSMISKVYFEARKAVEFRTKHRRKGVK